MITKDFIIALDFDGVLWDSVDEACYTGYRAYKILEGDIKAEYKLLKEQFRKGRFFVKAANDCFIIFYLLKQNPGIDFLNFPGDKFYSLRDKLREKTELFTEIFYKERYMLQNEDFNNWLSMQKAYDEVNKEFPLIKESFLDTIICSTKDEETIIKVLKHTGLSCKVYGRGNSLKKSDILINISEEKNVSPERIILVDDILENLIEVKKAGINAMMAEWGYNNKKEQKKAQKYHIPILKKKNILKQLSSFCEDINSNIKIKEGNMFI